MIRPHIPKKALFHGAVALIGLSFLAGSAFGQINLSAGSPYVQNFDTLATNGTTNPWTDNSTLTGWYAARAGGSAAAGPIPTYRADNGGSNAGGLDSYGSNSSTDRALGSLGSGSPGTIAYGIRLVNDTATGQTNFTITVTGEQWRNGGNTAVHTNTFSYLISNSAITDPDPANVNVWTLFSALNFASPTVGTPSAALDGNATSNRVAFSSITLPGVILSPGQELFLRWADIDNSGSDHGLSIDDLTITFEPASVTEVPPSISKEPNDTTVNFGETATFTIQAGGTAPLSYHWFFENSPVGTDNPTLTLPFVSTNQAGDYFVVVNNNLGSATSRVAHLTVVVNEPIETNIAYLRTLMDTNYAPRDTTNLYTVEGIVVTHANLTTSTNAQFYIQDSTGGIAVFVSGGLMRPLAGDLVRVTGPLGAFNGLFELNLVDGHPAHSVVILSTENPLPTPALFDFSSQFNPALMETNIEGRSVVVSNVFLEGGGATIFAAGGMNVNMMNLAGQTFVLRVDARVLDVIAKPVPVFASSIIGVMGQSDQASPFNSGYQLLITRWADLVEGTPPPPSVPLEIVRNAADIEIRWSTNFPGILQSNEDLGTTNWLDVGSSPAIDGTNYVINLGSPSDDKFFRLKN